uniref:Uncharacterized protein n=1 Tax=Panagrellus redivivus TaxID=6233 RepID=A0A7E4VCM5_PANRE
MLKVFLCLLALMGIVFMVPVNDSYIGKPLGYGGFDGGGFKESGSTLQEQVFNILNQNNGTIPGRLNGSKVGNEKTKN